MATQSITTPTPTQQTQQALVTVSPGKLATISGPSRLVELFPEWSDELFPLYAIYPSRLHRAAKVRAFIEYCLEIMGGNQSAAH